MGPFRLNPPRISIPRLACIFGLATSISMVVLCVACGGGAANSGGVGGAGGGSGSAGNFSVSLSSSTISLTSTAASQSVNVSIAGQGGFNSTAFCQITNLPSGVTANPQAFTVSLTAPQAVTFQADLQLSRTGTSTGQVSCTAGSLSASTPVTLSLQITQGFSLVLKPASISLTMGTSQNVMVAIVPQGGFVGNVSGTVTNLPAGVSVSQSNFTTQAANDVYLTFTAGTTGTLSSGTATITVTSGSLSKSINLPIVVSTAPDFSISSGIYTALIAQQGATAALTVSSTAYNGFTSPIAISFSGLPSGVSVSPATFTLTPGKSQDFLLSVSLTAALTTGTSITVTGSGSGVTHQTRFQLAIDAPSLNIRLQPTPVNLPAGSTASIEVQVAGTPRATGTITVQFAVTASGVKLSQPSVTIPGNGAMLSAFLTASSTATAGTFTATAAYGSASSSATANIAIQNPEDFPPVPYSGFESIVRTDALTPYTGFPEPNFTIYHAATNRFFSTDAYLNQLNIVDAATHKLTTIHIPGAFGLDQAPDGSAVYVATEMGDLYVVDPVHLTVVQRYASASISPYGFSANAVYALADGKLLLVRYFLVPGYSWVDGNGPMALWDPQTNDITFFTNSPTGQMPEKPICLDHFENIFLVNNRTRVVISPVLTSEGSSQLCSFDPEADTWNWSSTISGGSLSALSTFALSPDGTVLAAFDGYDVYNLDPVTLAVKNQFAASAKQYVLIYPNIFLSANNQKVFVPDGGGGDIYDAFDLATGTMAGWIPSPNIPAMDSYSPLTPYFQAVSASGVAAGVLQGGGVGLLDTSAIRPLPVGEHFTQTGLQVPFGPAGGGTATAWLPNIVGVPAPALGSVYFGSNAATDLNNNGIGSVLEAVAPAGTEGPVDVRALTTDGGAQYIPEGFSYGPWVQENTTNYATADGASQAFLFGYGFGMPTYTASYGAPPSDLQITVGGAATTVAGFNSNPYGDSYFVAPPFPHQALMYSIPPGSAGSTAPVDVSNSGGSTQTQVTYLPATKQFPVSGMLIDGVYDARRGVYYFTDATQIRVFSASENQWLASIPIPVAENAAGPERLFGIALSSDGSKLAVSDIGAYALYLLDPDSPNSIQSFPLGSSAIVNVPTGVAVTNSGTIYFAASDFNGDGAAFLFKLDPGTGQIASIGPSQLASLSPFDVYGRPTLTADETRLYIDDAGWSGYVDLASNQFVYCPVADYDLGDGSDEFVLAPNQTVVFGSGIFEDSNLSNLGIQTLDLAELIDANYVYGAAFSADASLFFQPGVNYIDVFNSFTGNFRARVSLPFALSPLFRALVSSGRDSTLVAITGNGDGIAVVDLNSLPEPEKLSYLPTPAMLPAHPEILMDLVQPTQNGSHRPPPARSQILHRIRTSQLLDKIRRMHSRSESPSANSSWNVEANGLLDGIDTR